MRLKNHNMFATTADVGGMKWSEVVAAKEDEVSF
jgi:hypothetical protein